MNRLFVEELVSVGMVAAGDNPDAEVLIYKSRDTQSPKREVSSMPTKKNSADSASTNREVTMDLSAIEDQELRKSIEDELAGLQSQIDELTPPSDPVEKAEPEVQEFIAKQQEEMANLQKKLDDEVAARRTAEYVVKAEPFQGLLGRADEMGPILADLATNAPDSYAKLESALTAAAQRVDLAGLFKVHGTEGEAETDPISKRDAWVEANRQTDESEEAARARFWKEHPDAVKESRE